MTNFDLCEKVYEVLKKLNVQTVIICAGARNAALIENMPENNFKKIYFFEERSAAFYALGLIQQTGKPVAVITTSGTAAAELLPATIEAFYQGLPLVLVTADRPKLYRGSGSPQSIHHMGIYSHYVEQSFDWDHAESKFQIQTALQSPLHLNICFDEPLIDQSSFDGKEVQVKKIEAPTYPVAESEDWKQIHLPLLIVGQLPVGKVAEVVDLILKLQAPVYLEALSQLQGNPDIASLVLHSSDTLIKKLFQARFCESVVRIGGVPTVRFWRDLESQFKNVPVFNFTDLPFTGLARPSQNFKLSFENLSQLNKNKTWLELKSKNSHLQNLKNELYNQFPDSEQSMVYHLSKQIGFDNIYLGNSLPIREWDLFSEAQVPNKKSQKIYANRGVNGIDGQISTYLGWSTGVQQSWCLVGDLTAMYDLASLGLTVADAKSKKRIVIMNNFGGQIFKRVFDKPHFLNTHQIEFKGWAEMWKWDYIKISAVADFENLSQLQNENIIIEIQPDLKQTEDFWNSWDLACKEI